MATKGRPDFRAIIVGGSVAGLTLAHAFEKMGVEYTLLERRDNIAPDLGAGIMICPNGATILDQLGVYETMPDTILGPIRFSKTTTAPGKSTPTSDALGLAEARLGYSYAIVERKAFLQSLYDQLLKKHNVHLNKQVETATQTSNGVVVKCRDGSEYHGDIVVGADGVRSTIRAEIQTLAAQDGHRKVKDTEAMRADFDIVYAVSSPKPGFKPNYMYRSCAHGHSSLVFVDKHEQLLWAFTRRLDKTYAEKDLPRRHPSEADAHIQKFPDFEIGCDTKLSELWKNVKTSHFAVLEEGDMETWAYGRFVCVGDSVHKATVNFGQGGNMAIESVATLSNTIAKMLDTLPPDGLTNDCIEKAFESYQEARKSRSKGFSKFSNKLARQETYEGSGAKFSVGWVSPLLRDYMANAFANSHSRGPQIEYLPLPEARVQGNYQWSPPEEIRNETWLRRALISSPLLLISYGATQTIGITIAQLLPLLRKASKTSLFEVGDGSAIQMPTRIYGDKGIDALMKALVAFFLPSLAGSDPVGRLQGIAFLSDVSVVVTISVIESIRTGNAYTFASAPFVALMMSQLKGAGIIMPIYFFLHYLTTPPKNYRAIDHRMTNIAYAKTLLPAIAATYILPSAAMLFYPNIMVRQYVNGIWQLFPLWLSLGHRLLAHTVKDTTSHDRRHNSKNDMQYLRPAYLLTGLMSASVYILLWTRSPFSMKAIFFSGLRNPGQAITSIAPASAQFLRYDYICTLGAGLYWTALQFWDLKRAQRTNTSWIKFLGSMTASTLLLGPGAAMAGFWSWREEMLGRKVVRKQG